MATIEGLGMPQMDELRGAFAANAPRRWGLVTSRNLSLIAEPETGALWLLCPSHEGKPHELPSTSVVRFHVRKVGESYHYFVGAESALLLKEVYLFLSGVVHRAEESTDPFPTVVEKELLAWESLLTLPSSLDRNRQIGMLGELWVLWRLLKNSGTQAVTSWTGPISEQHDFRLASEDLEVKTTLSHTRDHLINGLDQLVASASRPLLVASIQLKPAGAGPGVSLKTAVDQIATELAGDPVALQKFEKKLVGCGFLSAASAVYADRYCLRTSPALIPVDDSFPLLTSHTLAEVLPKSSLQRIRKVVYTASLDGLGAPIDSCEPASGLGRHEDGDLYA